jgi:hypothetical protein
MSNYLFQINKQETQLNKQETQLKNAKKLTKSINNLHTNLHEINTELQNVKTENVIISILKKKYIVLPYISDNNYRIIITNDTMYDINVYSNSNALIFNTFFSPSGTDKMILKPFNYAEFIFCNYNNNPYWNAIIA